jgi:Fungal specific transcription factor domain
MKDAVRARSHTLSRLEGQLNALPKAYTREQTFNATDADLVALLPAKQDVDTLIGVYLDNFETCYHILHLPTFWRDYGAFWASRSEIGAAYVVLMLLAIATARCAAPDERYVSIKPITSDPDWAKVRINECEAWLRRQSQKHLRSDTFQHHCLLVLAKHVNRIKVKAAWRSSVALVTFAMTTGLHRKYDFLGGKVSVFHQEMRRRFWTTIAELELQAAFDRGMTCFTSTTPWDCERPANIDDTDITEESQRLPESRPREDYTDAAFLHASRSSFELRSSLVSLINNPSTRLQPCHVLDYEAKINEELGMIPKWSSLSGEVGVWPQCAMVPQVLLATQLRQLLIAVHTPFAQQKGNNPWSSYSRLQCLNAAGIVIDQQSNLTASGYHGLALLRNDVIRASLCISKNLMLSNSLSSTHAPIPSSIISRAHEPQTP